MENNKYKEMTDEQLTAKVNNRLFTNSKEGEMAAELFKRQLKREDKRLIKLKEPHWSLTPLFIVAILTMIFAAIAAYPIIKEWIQLSPSVNINSSSQLPQLNLKTTKQEVPITG